MKKNTFKRLLILPFVLQSFLSFSQTTVIAGSDSYTWDTYSALNYGTRRLIVSYDSSTDLQNNLHNRDAYLKFNIASIPTVVTAKLRLTLESAPATTTSYTAYLVNDSWTNGGITWNNAPAVIGTAIATGSNTGAVIEFDVTTEVTAHQTNGDDLISIKIVSFEEDYVSLIYSTNTAASDADKPRLVINDPTLSLDNEVDSSIISVYPNPTNNNLYIKGLTIDETTIYIYNTLGQLLKQEVYTNNVNFSSLETGVYYVKVLNGTKEETFSIVKK